MNVGHEEPAMTALERLFEQKNMVDEWKKGNWNVISEWLGDFDITSICSNEGNDGDMHKIIKLDSSN